MKMGSVSLANGFRRPLAACLGGHWTAAVSVWWSLTELSSLYLSEIKRLCGQCHGQNGLTFRTFQIMTFFIISLISFICRQACSSHHQIVIWICFGFCQTQLKQSNYGDGNAVNVADKIERNKCIFITFSKFSSNLLSKLSPKLLSKLSTLQI